ncbi:Aldo/keto reductase family protein [Bosea robiniae]|uniref:Aldo/keto reductase family protein n=1 Tax=Bosea robiniae TaxID=1036780 RepID=A0ABY0PA23_9HYPH|nr:Aldo/keto reductase family protein [Bosea robiniae]
MGSEELVRAIEDNLRNLGVDALDVVNLRIMFDSHGPVEGSIAAPLEVLAALKRRGVVRNIGLSNVTPAQVQEARGIAEIVCVQNHYNLAHRGDDILIDDFAEAGIAYVPFFPLGGFAPLQSAVLAEVATRLDATAMQVALAWLLRRASNMPAFDVAVFAGDIGKPTAAAVGGMLQQQQRGPLSGRPVVYVPGNHEFYGSEMKSSLAAGREAAEAAGIELIARRTVVINGVRFIGCISWTDYRLLGTPQLSMVFAGQELNDHRLIRYREDSFAIARTAVTTAASCPGVQRPNTGSILLSFAARL